MKNKTNWKLQKISLMILGFILIVSFSSCYIFFNEMDSYSSDYSTPNDEKLMTVVGFVTSKEDGVPVKNIKVAGNYGYTRTDAKGYFELMVYLDKKTDRTTVVFEDDDGNKNAGRFKKNELTLKEYKYYSTIKQIIECDVQLEKQGDAE